MHHLRAHTLSLYPRAGLNSAWVSGSPYLRQQRHDGREQLVGPTSGRGGRSHDSSPRRRSLTSSQEPFLCSMMNVPRTSSGGIRSERHIMRHIRKSSFVACTVPSVGFYGHVVTTRRFVTTESLRAHSQFVVADDIFLCNEVLDVPVGVC